MNVQPACEPVSIHEVCLTPQQEQVSHCLLEGVYREGCQKDELVDVTRVSESWVVSQVAFNPRPIYCLPRSSQREVESLVVGVEVSGYLLTSERYINTLTLFMLQVYKVVIELDTCTFVS